MKIQLSAVVSLMVAGILAGCASSSTQSGGKIGLQMYSLREQLPKKTDATLDEIQSWGVRYVELAGTYGKTPEDFKADLTKRGLIPVSGHFGFEEWARDPEAVCAQAEKFGLKFAGCAWIPHQDPFDEAQIKKAAEVFNHAGEVAAKHGIQFFYHTHGYEFKSAGDGTAFDMLVKETNPQNVKFEADVFWIADGGADPAALISKYPDRFALMHVKDARKGTEVGHGGAGDNVVAGQGQLDMAAIINAGKKAGMAYYFIEDESSVSEQQIPQTIAFLKQFLSE